MSARGATEAARVPMGRYLVSAIEPEIEVLEDWPLRGERLTGQWRIYLGPRWAHRYIVVSEATAERTWVAFNAQAQLYIGVPETTQIHSVPEVDRLDRVGATEADTIKKVYAMMREITKRRQDDERRAAFEADIATLEDATAGLIEPGPDPVTND